MDINTPDPGVEVLRQWEDLQVLSTVALPGQSYDMYAYNAPEALSGLAFTGGWFSAADIGPDVIYVSPVGDLSHPAPLTWTNPSFAAQYHNNDPSIINAWGGKDFIFFTSLSNQYTSFEDITTHNMISLGVSSDHGKTWTDQGEILSGWAPCALQVNFAIELFFHNAAAETQIAFIAEDGKTVIVPPTTLWDSQGNHPLHALNVSVVQIGKELILVGNGGADGSSFGDIVAYEAHAYDPLHWKPLLSSGPVLIHGGNSELLTPEIHSLGGNAFSLTFTQDLAHDANGFPNLQSQGTVTMNWAFELQ